MSCNVQIESSHLKNLVPINQLEKSHRLRIAEKSHIVELSAGDQLTSNEEHRWFMYLLKGKLDLVDIDRQVMMVQSTDDRAFHPLFNDGERKTSLVAQTSCVVAQFDKQLFHAFVDQELLSGEELHTIEMSESEGLLFNEIMHAFNMSGLSLPSFSANARKIKAALNRPGLNLESLFDLTASDPVLAVHLISKANMPVLKGNGKSGGISAAIQLIGVESATLYMQKLLSREIFQSDSEMLNKQFQQFYGRSLEIACMASVISRLSGQLSADHAFLAGLLHEIGIVPILVYIERTKLSVGSDEELARIIRHLKPAIGSMVIQQFNLSGDMVDVVETESDWTRDVSGDVDVCDLVIMAQIYYRLKYHQLDGLPSMDKVPAFKKLFNNGFDKSFSAKVFTQSQEMLTGILGRLKI